MRPRAFLPAIVAALLIISAAAPVAAQRITSPRQEFGHEIGADYKLVNYAQLSRYWRKLARESARMKLEQIGTTAEGRPMLMAIITSPENHARLARYRQISERLARAEGLTDAEARALAREGKAVIWIDGGLHATEVLGSQQLIQFVYEMVSRNNAETQRFLRDAILLAVLANPDGMDLVADWYMREPVPEKRTTSGVPRLYQKYVGHDNNRDSYMASQPETRAMDSIMFRAWYPQIMYNHHQTGPEGTVLFAPPFRDPFNYNLDPMIPVAIDLVGAAMHTRFIAEGKPGATMRDGASFSTWWNGGLRTTVYFHNMIGLLTETFGNPTPSQIVLVPDRLLPSGSTPWPVLPQPWHFAQALEYELTANRAVLDIASRYREDFLYNIYRMGRNSIERGSRDNWTLTPKLIAVLRDTLDAAKGWGRRVRGGSELTAPAEYARVLTDPARRDARGYIIPADQPDFPTAVKFVNALVKTGVTVHRATAPFAVAGKSYPAGSYVVRTAQAFRPHVLDMFEPQHHPDDIPYPGGPPTPPYDNAGWTLAYQMGVRFDRVLDGFSGPFQRLTGFAPTPAAPVAAGVWLGLPRTTNDAFAAVNRMLARGEAVYTAQRPIEVGGKQYGPGTFFVRVAASTMPIARELATERGVRFESLGAGVDESALARLKLPRIALWDVYGGSMSSGWMRFVLEQFEFPYEVVFARELDAGNLNGKYDVLILPDGAVLEGDSARTPRQPEVVPPEWESRLGRITVARTLPQLRAFVGNGGTLLALDSASTIGFHLGLPVSDAVVDSEGKSLPRAQYYVPGSILQVAVDTSNPVAWGMPSQVDVFFDNSPAFRLGSDARSRSTQSVAWFASPEPLRSGWAWGQSVLNGASQLVVAPLGRGTVVLYGPEVHFRSQSHGAFRFLFNGIYYAQVAPR